MRYLVIIPILVTCAYIALKMAYKASSIQDEVEAPIDYDSEAYKEAEAYFVGIGRI